MSRWFPAYIGIGSNLGDSLARVGAAFEAIGSIDRTRLIARSRLYRTRPFGPVEQGEFINAVAGVLTQLSAQSLFEALRAIQRIEEPGLTVPHPGIAERGFVLAPLHDIAPTLQVPGMGSVEDLLRRLPDDGIAGLVAT